MIVKFSGISERASAPDTVELPNSVVFSFAFTVRSVSETRMIVSVSASSSKLLDTVVTGVPVIELICVSASSVNPVEELKNTAPLSV